MAIPMHAKRLIAKIMIVSFTFILMAGCSNPVNPNVSSSNASSASSSSDSSSTASTVVSSAVSSAEVDAASSSVPVDNAKAVLAEMMESAKKGLVFGCEFPVKTTVIENVTAKWGKADKTQYVAAAKGTYSDYSKKKIVLGFNKGSQIFEARSFDSKLSAVTLSKAKEIYGNPAYTNTTNGETVIGYVVSKELKLLLVFTLPADKNSDPVLDHYSVLYPSGTVNSMADDPGREW